MLQQLSDANKNLEKAKRSLKFKESRVTYGVVRGDDRQKAPNEVLNILASRLIAHLPPEHDGFLFPEEIEALYARYFLTISGSLQAKYVKRAISNAKAQLLPAALDALEYLINVGGPNSAPAPA